MGCLRSRLPWKIPVMNRGRAGVCHSAGGISCFCLLGGAVDINIICRAAVLSGSGCSILIHLAKVDWRVVLVRNLTEASAQTFTSGDPIFPVQELRPLWITRILRVPHPLCPHLWALPLCSPDTHLPPLYMALDLPTEALLKGCQTSTLVPVVCGPPCLPYYSFILFPCA